jgi:hypothetical protein
VTRRSRTLAYGTAALLVLAGTLCAIVLSGELGELLTFVLITFGLGGAVLLVFYEVGLSEDRERSREERQRAREERQRERSQRPAKPARNPRFQGSRFRRRP